MTADPMGPAVFITPPVSLIVTQGVGFIGDLAFLIRLQDLDSCFCISFVIFSMTESLVAMLLTCLAS